MRLSFLLLLFAVARAFHPAQRAHHHRLRRAPSSILAMSTFALSSTPSLSLSSLSEIPLSSSPPSSSSVPPQSTFAFSSAVPSTTSTPPSASSQSSVALPSSTPFPSAASTSAATPTTSASSAPVDAVQSQPTSSSTPTTSLAGAAAPTQDFSSSVVVHTSTSATPSSTATHSSSSGFFSNTGAVAGTFTVVGLFSIAGVIAVVLLIVRRRQSRPYDEDTEFLDKSPDLSAHPPITQVTSLDDGSASDHAHYGAPPMALPAPPVAYYPDHAYALHPRAFSPEAYHPPGQLGRPSHPVASTQGYPPQRMYFPEDYDIAYPPLASRVGANMPNPHEFTDMELDSAQTALPSALRPSVNSTPSVPKQWASTRFSVDSFYAGITNDTPSSPGRAV